MLPDREIAQMIEDKIIGLTPYTPALLQPASIDVRLHPTLRVPKRNAFGAYDAIDMRRVNPGHTMPVPMSDEAGFILLPGAFVLGCTIECLTLPDDIVARVEGKSSVGRVGLAVHITAGFIDPGFEGQVTLEIANLAPWPVILWPEMPIAQIAFSVLDSPADAPYGTKGHYQGQTGPTESRYRFA